MVKKEITLKKLNLKTRDLTQENIRKLTELFPQLIIETEKGGKLIRTIDILALKELIGDYANEEGEVYSLNWVGKKISKKKIAEPINKTLRPVIKDSVDFEDTKNLYIEGDNFEVLKLLRESYLNSVKMIYIDPPYNTGNDFVYRDNYAVSKGEYEEEAGAIDDEGNKLFKINNNTNPRFHSDWLSMMYERLNLARDLLQDDGVIFISIDDHEFANLRKICDEIFGEGNFVANIIWQKKFSPQNDATYFSTMHDYILCIAKQKKESKDDKGWERILLPRNEMPDNYSNPDNDPRGAWSSGDFTGEGVTKNCVYEITSPTGKKHWPPKGKRWVYNKENFEKLMKENRFWFGKDGNAFPRIKRYYSEVQQGMVPNTIWFHQDAGHTQEGKQEVNKLFGESVFDYPKPVRLIKRILQISTLNNSQDIILDFFAGSGTTAQAVLELNAEDGGNRKFIMVQLPEETDKESEAYKAGYKNICEIGKERIRRAGKLILEELKEKDKQKKLDDKKIEKQNLDIGFKVFRLSDSNMKDVYYNPKSIDQRTLGNFKDNIKEDRTPEDLVYQVLIDMAIPLDAKIKTEKIGKNKVFVVQTNSEEVWLTACFDDSINLDLVKEMTKLKPRKIVFRDSSFKDDKDKVNCEEFLKHQLPNAEMRVI